MRTFVKFSILAAVLLAALTGCSSTGNPNFFACALQSIANDVQTGNIAIPGMSVAISIPVITQIGQLVSTEAGVACNDGVAGPTPAPVVVTPVPSTR